MKRKLNDTAIRQLFEVEALSRQERSRLLFFLRRSWTRWALAALILWAATSLWFLHGRVSQVSVPTAKGCGPDSMLVGLIHKSVEEFNAFRTAHPDCAIVLCHARLDHVDLTGINLKNAVLDHADFTGSIMIGADLRGVRARHATFKNVQLEKSTLRGALFTESDFSKSTMQATDLSQMRMVRSQLRASRMDSSRLDSAQFHETDFREAVLNHATAFYTRLLHSDLRGADARAIIGDSVLFRDCNLFETQMDEQPAMRLENCTFKE